MKKKIFFIALGLLIAGGSVWYILNGGQDQSANDTASSVTNTQTVASDVQKDSVVEILKKQKDLKEFNKLLEISGVQSSLQTAGPYTVLAPTDDAFKALPEDVLETIKKPENKTMLAAIVNYHIVKGNIRSNTFQNGQKLPTVNGQEVVVEVADATTYFLSAKGDKATIKKADITASNGQIHTISVVLLPQ